MVTVIPQASWLSSSWSLKEMEESASSMMTAMPTINQSEPCSCLTAGQHVITEMETYGTQHIVDIYLLTNIGDNYDMSDSMYLSVG